MDLRFDHKNGAFERLGDFTRFRRSVGDTAFWYRTAILGEHALCLIFVNSHRSAEPRALGVKNSLFASGTDHSARTLKSGDDHRNRPPIDPWQALDQCYSAYRALDFALSRLDILHDIHQAFNRINGVIEHLALV